MSPGLIVQVFSLLRGLQPSTSDFNPPTFIQAFCTNMRQVMH